MQMQKHWIIGPGHELFMKTPIRIKTGLMAAFRQPPARQSGNPFKDRRAGTAANG
jgi:hypothetical protein